MARPALLDSLTRIVEPVVQSKRLSIWGIEILQAIHPVVRIYVDAPPSVLADTAPKTRTGLPTTAPGTTQGSPQNAVSPEDIAEDIAAPEARSSVTIRQCSEISRLVGLALEVENIFSSAYVLEVSSPGLSRTFFRLEQMVPYVGETVDIMLHEPHPEFPGRRKFRGQLQSVTDNSFTLMVEAGAEHEAATLDVAWDEVRKATRTHVFVAPQKPGKKRTEGK